MNDQSNPPAEDGAGSLSSDGTFQITPTDYSDNRKRGDFASRYPFWAWAQIASEGIFLVTLIIAALTEILIAATRPDFILSQLTYLLPGYSVTLSANVARAVQLWSVVGFSGILGSAAFSLKWLYHSVAWREWNRDRIIWRLSVPIQGGLLALFTGAMIISGIIPLLSKQIFLRILSCAGFGFFVGLFADNFLAALQKFARRILGTLGSTT